MGTLGPEGSSRLTAAPAAVPASSSDAPAAAAWAVGRGSKPEAKLGWVPTFWERCGCRPCCADDPSVLDTGRLASVHAIAVHTEMDELVSPWAAPKSDFDVSAIVQEDAEFQIEDGARYKGQWQGRLFHGCGVLDRGDGSRYEGEFVRGKAHGRGRYVHINGSTYEGEWADDEKAGSGVEVYTDGSWYRGQFAAGIKEGVGAYVSSSGSVLFEGQMRADTMHGEGSYRFGDGRLYEGEWRSGHMTGSGVMRFPDGSEYTGGMKDDVRQGAGTFRLASGQLFRGQWLDGKPDGVCVVVGTDGREIESIWKDGKRVMQA